VCSVKNPLFEIENIYDIIHDLKTPLAAMLGFIELLKNNQYTQQTTTQFYDIIYDEAKRLLSLIDSIKLSEEKSVNCCINTIIEEIIKQNLSILKKMNIAVDFLNENLYFVFASKIKLYRIFANIIENSIKYNKPNGSIFVKIQNAGTMNIVKIKDTGIGIRETEIKYIFNPLFRSTATKNSSIPGSGRGLAIVKKFVESLSGNIEVKSQFGKYTEFSVYLPMNENQMNL
jgi:signal transduction histidine kinase